MRLLESTSGVVVPEQPVPRVSTADLERVVHRDFGAARAPEVLAILEDYGGDRADATRVRLALVKLSAGCVDRLHRELDVARTDPRDVLAAAEYPGYIRIPWRELQLLPPDELQRVIDSDWKQYRDWLAR